MTPRERDVLEAVKAFWKKYGYGPSIPEIAVMIGRKSFGGIPRMLKSLEEQGFVERPVTATGRARQRAVRPTRKMLPDSDKFYRKKEEGDNG